MIGLQHLDVDLDQRCQEKCRHGEGRCCEERRRWVLEGTGSLLMKDGSPAGNEASGKSQFELEFTDAPALGGLK